MLNRYGKPSAALIDLKKSFFENNEELLNKGREVNKIYSQQPRRETCKNCNYPIKNLSFSKQGVDYGMCEQCGHMNGLFQDTMEFCSAVYTDDDGESYAKSYNSADEDAYVNRVKNIYIPKVEFLIDSLKQLGESPDKLTYSDFGAGSGYFISALVQSGLQKSVGYEVSKAQVSLGNAMLKKDLLVNHSLDMTANLASTIDADVVSMIGVLEHIQNPREILRALQINSNVRYYYISVPLFGPSVFLEMVFPTVMQRQLSAGHTHLYTESSLKWMADKFGMELTAAWWFGTDMVDLFRNVAVRLGQQDETKNMSDAWAEMICPLIDSMQVVIDKKHLASEVHMLFKYKS